MTAPDDRTRNLRFILLLATVSLFADFTYEGARSITGPFLASLGASATAVGLVAGLGELSGYALRLVSGRLADRSGRLWPLTLRGYGVQMLAVPALALAPGWPAVAALIVCERVGRALRKPPRDVMLATAASGIGRGLGFGLNEALDQVGAMAGPLMAAWVLALHGDHRTAFAWLLAPALMTLALLGMARVIHPSRGILVHPEAAPGEDGAALPRPYWIVLAGAGLVAAGFADYSLVAFHFTRQRTLEPAMVPVVYALAMGASGLGSLLCGRWFDRRGIVVLAVVTVATALFAPLVFMGPAAAAVAGTILWGLGTGAHESVIPAAVASMVPGRRLAWAYGVFHAGYGVAWFAGSVALGALYDVRPVYAVVLSLALQIAAVPCFLAARLHAASRP